MRAVQILALLPLVAFAAARERLSFDAETNSAPAAAAYIAPENLVLYRMRYPDGSYREFEHNFDNPDVLYSVGGWRGRVKGRRIFVRSGKNVEGGRAEFVFDRGRLVSFSLKGKTVEFPYDAPRPLAGTVPPYHFGEEWMTDPAAVKKAAQGKRRAVVDAKVMKVYRGKWKRSGRFRWPFPNPNENGCLYASLALLSCFLFFVRRRWLKVLGGGLFLASCIALIATASRGSILALGVGLVPVMALKAKTLFRAKSAWILAALVVAAAAGWFFTHDSRLFTRGFKGSSTWSNDIRIDMWRAAPKMMAEAPGGWNFAHVGRAYMDWYQPLEIVARAPHAPCGPWMGRAIRLSFRMVRRAWPPPSCGLAHEERRGPGHVAHVRCRGVVQSRLRADFAMVCPVGLSGDLPFLETMAGAPPPVARRRGRWRRASGGGCVRGHIPCRVGLFPSRLSSPRGRPSRLREGHEPERVDSR